MKCDHPECTSYHSNRGPAEWRCPSCLPLRAVAQARYKVTAKGMVTDMRYNATRRAS